MIIPLDLTKKYRTRDGKEFQHTYIGKTHIAGFADGAPRYWHLDGSYLETDEIHPLDLIEATENDELKITQDLRKENQDLKKENDALLKTNDALLKTIEDSKREGEKIAFFVAENANLAASITDAGSITDSTYKVKYRPFVVEHSFPVKVKHMGRFEKMSFLEALSRELARKITAILAEQILASKESTKP